MASTIIESAVYSGPLTHPDPGDLASAAQLKTGVNQIVADRTRFLFIDALGTKIANAVRREVVTTTDDLLAVVAGDPTGQMAVVVCGENGRIATSTNGDTFTARTAGGGFTGSFRAGINGPGSGRTILVGANQIQTSDNASTWTQRTIGAGPTTPDFWVIAASPGAIVAAGQKVGGALVQRSIDNGTTWTDIALPGPPASVGARGLVWSGTRFFLSAVLAGTTNVYSSTDGATWTLQGSTANVGAGPFYHAATAWNTATNMLVMAREGGVVASSDLGVTWSPLIPLTTSNGGGGSPTSIVFARGAFIALQGGAGGEAWISDTGVEWFRCGVLPTTAGLLNAVYVRGRWFAPSSDGNVVTSSRSAEF